MVQMPSVVDDVGGSAMKVSLKLSPPHREGEASKGGGGGLQGAIWKQQHSE